MALVLTMCAHPALADQRQYKIETAYLYSFFNYITWPGFDSPQELQKPVVCINSDDPILPYLGYINTKMSHEREITIRSVADSNDIVGCHIFFVRHRLPPQIMSNLKHDTLVVFKPDDPLDRGGMIELSEDGERIAIKINRYQLEERGFQVSSRLLELAQAVR